MHRTHTQLAETASLGAVAITGLGSYLPDAVIANTPIAARIGVDDAWIERRTGISSRHRAAPEQQVRDLATEAAHAALADAGLGAPELDLVLVASVTQEQPIPNIAPQVAHAINATRAGAFDIGAACSGFLAGLATASAFIESGRAKHVMIVAADLLSRHTDAYDRQTAALFGDGAAAAIISAGAGHGRWAIELGCDGASAELIETDRRSGMIRMRGHDTFIHAVRSMEQSARSVCRQAEVAVEDVDAFVFHQANARITRALTERLGADPRRVVDCIATIGNISAASVPFALERARTELPLRGGDTVLLAAVGAGFIWGAALIQWDAT